jgi:hypothetical protein
MDILYRWSCPFVFHLIVFSAGKEGEGRGNTEGEARGLKKKLTEKWTDFGFFEI